MVPLSPPTYMLVAHRYGQGRIDPPFWGVDAAFIWVVEFYADLLVLDRQLQLHCVSHHLIILFIRPLRTAELKKKKNLLGQLLHSLHYRINVRNLCDFNFYVFRYYIHSSMYSQGPSGVYKPLVQYKFMQPALG